MSTEKSKIGRRTSGRPQNVGGESAERDPVLTIEGLAAGGRGVARHEGRVWFVRGAIPGDRLQARVERDRPRFVEAVAGRREADSPDRREAPCPAQGRCGGCPWMVLDEAAQAAWKRRLVEDALTRIGRVPAPAVEPVLRPSEPLRYRNRVEFSAGAGFDGGVAIGLRGEFDGRRGIVDLPGCLLQAPAGDRMLERIRAFVRERPEVGRALIERGPFRLLLRSTADGGVWVGLWDSDGPFPAAEELAEVLRDGPDPARSVVRLSAALGGRGGVRTAVLAGSTLLRERLGELEFDLSPSSFVQVSPAGGEALIRTVLELAGDVERRAVLDLFGGVGAFGLHLAQRGARPVVVCDADRAAVAAGRRAARRAGLRVGWAHATVRAFLRSAPRADVVVANPPRSGFGKGVAEAILESAPALVIAVSCDPPTLARDLRPFLGAGYRLERVVPIDLFPQTYHVETVVRLRATAPRPPRQAGSPRPASG